MPKTDGKFLLSKRPARLDMGKIGNNEYWICPRKKCRKKKKTLPSKTKIENRTCTSTQNPFIYISRFLPSSRDNFN